MGQVRRSQAYGPEDEKRRRAGLPPRCAASGRSHAHLLTDIIRHAEELQLLATTDGMTGTYNRRHFMTLADLEWNKAHRYERPLSLLMLDIDHFKSINDTYGHDAGDRVIIQLANLVGSCKRAPDVLARIGGEEFALLLPEIELLHYVSK